MARFHCWLLVGPTEGGFAHDCLFIGRVVAVAALMKNKVLIFVNAWFGLVGGPMECALSVSIGPNNFLGNIPISTFFFMIHAVVGREGL